MDKTQETEEKERKVKKLTKKLGHGEELVDHYWGSINYSTALIKSSEIKAGLILSFYGILLNLIYKNLSIVFEEAVHHVFLYVLLGIWAIATMISIFFSIRCFMPRIEGKFDDNVFFFRDVITKYGDVRAFSKTFYNLSLNQEELFYQLGQQIYINSKIANAKFKAVNRSIQFLATGLAVLFILGIAYLALTN